MRGAGTDAVTHRAVLRSRDHARMRGEAQVVVAAEVQDLAPVDDEPRALPRFDRAPAAVEAGRVARCVSGRELGERARNQAFE